MGSPRKAPKRGDNEENDGKILLFLKEEKKKGGFWHKLQHKQRPQGPTLRGTRILRTKAWGGG